MNTEKILMYEVDGIVWKNIRIYRTEAPGDENVVYAQLLNAVNFMGDKTFTYDKATPIEEIIHFLKLYDIETYDALTDQDDAG